MVVPSDQRPKGLSLPASRKVSKSCAGLREVIVPVAAANGCVAKQVAQINNQKVVWTRRFESQRSSFAAQQETFSFGAIESDSVGFVFGKAIFIFLFCLFSFPQREKSMLPVEYSDVKLFLRQLFCFKNSLETLRRAMARG